MKKGVLKFSNIDRVQYRELDSYVSSLEGDHPYLKAIKERYLDRDAIEQIGDNWEVSWLSGGFSKYACLLESDKIGLGVLLKGFDRDVSLLHEVVHIWHGEISYDCSHPLLTPTPEESMNRAITEWLARQKRADPEILACLWDCFSIPTEIYDISSLRASKLRRGGQIYFDFWERSCDGPLMDHPIRKRKKR